ncbi:hypothetical protein GLA29479_567 [Lysobacter antibioticus]|nr:hypothetical protein GLA29479_567 [Lysobacter antibioticus]
MRGRRLRISRPASPAAQGRRSGDCVHPGRPRTNPAALRKRPDRRKL